MEEEKWKTMATAVERKVQVEEKKTDVQRLALEAEERK